MLEALEVLTTVKTEFIQCGFDLAVVNVACVVKIAVLCISCYQLITGEVYFDYVAQTAV